jgi:hypothetical protein
MPRAWFELTIPAFEWSKTIRALIRMATGIGYSGSFGSYFLLFCCCVFFASPFILWSHTSTLPCVSIPQKSNARKSYSRLGEKKALRPSLQFSLIIIVYYKHCYELDDRGFESRQGLGIFLFPTTSRPALGPTQPPPLQWVPGALSLGIKRPWAWSWPLTSI